VTAPAPLVIVSKSEPKDHVQRLCALGLNAVAGEAGTDYVWYPHSQQWGIERKTVSNLLGSLADRQLVEQVHRGAKQFDRYIILIEGAYARRANGKLDYHSPSDPRARSDGWVESKWEYASVVGMLLALQLVGDRANVLVHHWPVLYDSPTAIASIVQQTSSESGSRFTRERQRPDLPATAVLGGELYSDALWALMALPGIGAEVAEALIREHGSLYNVVLAAAGDGFANVKINGKRLGDKRAEKIKAAITTSFK